MPLCPTLLFAALVSQSKAPKTAPLLTFSKLLQDADGRLAPTTKLLAANGKHIRLQGFVAQLEEPTKGGFWLCPRPVVGDESGGGTADLPPESVFVIVRSSPNTAFKPPRRPIEVAGLLQVGAKAMADGTMTHLRLILDRTAPKAFLPSSPAAKRPLARKKS